MTSQNSPEQAIREQAAEWAVLRSAGPLTPEQEQALARWLASDPRHAQALTFAQKTWADLGRLGAMDPLAPVASLPAARPLAGRRRHSRLRWTLSAAATLVLAVVGVEQAPSLSLALRADYATAKGEVRQVSLPDGSQVDLDSQSGIELAYSDNERRVRLLAGEAVFTVAPLSGNEQRPFVVERAGGSSRALGTRFVVGLEPGGGTWVGMLEHSVAVTLQAAPPTGSAEQVLKEGQSLRYDTRHGIRLWPEQDVRRASAWQRGVLVFEREPLAQVATRLNRYRAGHVLITDQALARREVSGMFRLDNLDAALAMLTDELKASRLDLPGLTLIY
ncbi:FecR family protein [Pseudomonas rubra]|uniref:FecR family protein n=1 Tax=Pseudomonas rubra TaxID=2942627 RepID=A0ABT5P8H0_9PSED|nr:FecR family protein [Pseudomonas rubra]MDD1014482.1 FecR family protein [Pseudomonas rubra]MDD1037895.1 FecR family protein [Pseudomonas rubra]MDD1155328.1 FecR family protein [Pseudomonas rubra]